MKLKIVIVSVAVFSCLVPPALSSAILATKAIAAVGAVKGAAILAKKGALAVATKGAAAVLAAKGVAALAAKGAALKGAALLAAKGAAVKGAALLAAKGAVLKGAATLAIKGAAVAGAVALGAKAVKAGAAVAAAKLPIIKPWFLKSALLSTPTISYAPVYEVRPINSVIPPVPPQFPAVLVEHLAALWGTAKTSLIRKASAVGEVITALHSSKYPAPPVVVEVNGSRQNVYTVPVVEKVELVG